MAEPTQPNPKTTDPRGGFSPETKTYRSLRPSVPLPPLTQPLSLTDYTLSLLHLSLSSPLTSSTPFLIDSFTSDHLSYSSFLLHTRSLSLSLRRLLLLRRNNHRVVALVLSPPSLHLPVLYFSLLSLGIVLSPANPLSSPSELAHIVHLSKPVIAFSTSSLSPNLPESLPVVLLDSPEFLRMITTHDENENPASTADGVSKKMVPTRGNNAATAEGFLKTSEVVLKMMATRENSTGAATGEGYEEERRVAQSDTAAILYSSGTTGRVKGVELTHRNFISLIAGFYYLRRGEEEGAARAVALNPLPLFHVFGFFMLIRAAAMGETVVLMERFDFEGMLRAVERFKVSYMPVSPPLVVAMAKSEVVGRYDLGSLRVLGCGGAPLGKEAAERFRERFPDVEIVQGYGLTETGGGATRMLEPEETKRPATVGRLAEMMEAKIVDPVTGEALSPGHRGELWLRGPSVMKGYVGDDEATAATLDAEGWLKTGDLCYFDSDGFLYIVDRLKELIKYKAYQVPPAELEHLLQSNSEIVEAAVIPYPDEEAGQIPMAFVVRKPGSSITEAQIMDFIARQVAPYKKIRRVAFINSIPKSPAGKILRRELVNRALSGTSSKL